MLSVVSNQTLLTTSPVSTRGKAAKVVSGGCIDDNKLGNLDASLTANLSARAVAATNIDKNTWNTNIKVAMMLRVPRQVNSGNKRNLSLAQD